MIKLNKKRINVKGTCCGTKSYLIKMIVGSVKSLNDEHKDNKSIDSSKPNYGLLRKRLRDEINAYDDCGFFHNNYLDIVYFSTVESLYKYIINYYY